ncbi:hypothetical protein KDA_42850 [Dictyobacter alpinus]|uniref:Uncharacterized protein n=1 Tax=Dictyobacter alpinus TaxID=2014873 RepID=A0A402BBJ5_9CHLR|nr:hypothetical protein [Dictyobacter alpinus]GCE28801.1 hypothetical protein KDA_42850 [Dictyobacter alpinus]
MYPQYLPDESVSFTPADRVPPSLAPDADPVGDVGPDWLQYYQQDNDPSYPASWLGQDNPEASRRQRHQSLLAYGWEQEEW